MMQNVLTSRILIFGGITINSWGEKFRVSIFGESHGVAIGAVLDGVPAGVCLDLNFINFQMSRRAPGRSDMSTSRFETDSFEFLSGVKDGVTSGAPVCFVIKNEDTQSGDYSWNIPRPSHADYVGFVKYGRHHDCRGGGHFSGRLTAVLVCAGSIARKILMDKGIFIGAHIKRVADVCDDEVDKMDVSKELLDKLQYKDFSVISDICGAQMQSRILEAKDNESSVGGIVECLAIGLTPGLGEPFFQPLEGMISSIMFAVPAVKGIEFGSGFELAQMMGHDANDEMYYDIENQVCTHSNHNGGINGGISNGMPLIFSVVIKPTPSILRMQRSIDLESAKNVDFKIQGRHDPCIVQRAVVVIESALAICIYDMLRRL